jgi:prepilin-type N-terminal cleavage/methylation domain-containing protein
MRTQQKGFTLIELMIALFIALIIFTIGFMTISGAISARREAEARIRAAESARLMFQLLEKDMAGAYPQPGVADISTLVNETTGMPLLINHKNMNDTNDRLEFFTRMDHRDLSDSNHTDSPDTYVFVRYFVNSFGHLCREVHTVDSPAQAETLYPFDRTNDSYALCDQMYAMLIAPAQWNDSTKSMVIGPGYQCSASTTHVQVSLFMFGYSGANATTDNSGQTKRVFQKTVAVADVFRAQP